MPLKKGFSQSVISHNVKEMMASGHEHKQAVSAAMASAHKYHKMAKGGMVYQDGDFEPDVPEQKEGDKLMYLNNGPEHDRSIREMSEQASFQDTPTNPHMQDEDSMFAHAMRKRHMHMGGEMMAYGGMVENKPSAPGDMMKQHEGDSDIGYMQADNRPSAPGDMNTHPSMEGLSEAVKEAIMNNKKKKKKMMM